MIILMRVLPSFSEWIICGKDGAQAVSRNLTRKSHHTLDEEHWSSTAQKPELNSERTASAGYHFNQRTPLVETFLKSCEASNVHAPSIIAGKTAILHWCEGTFSEKLYDDSTDQFRNFNTGLKLRTPQFSVVDLTS
ncbi:hypothetical protein KIN20_002484 [Parelaphostrongylus tenuis]|uniref:Uncharacterized protein n=1 Tax=Parelaphostrongylus tenuis TaxID=148309 RepID=A0AAD5MGQ2_PARTN|nr:hypothetical protein KIN20_002484 [Parelaphostrongylus tenuis]